MCICLKHVIQADHITEVQTMFVVIALLFSEGDDVPDPKIVSDLMTMLNEHNPLVQKFRMARDRLLSPDSPDIAIKLRGVLDGHGDMYSTPSASELAALIIGGSSPQESSFDIIVETRSSQLKSVSPIHPSLMALQYPLLFPYGQPGFHTSIKLTETDYRDGGRDMSSMYEFYASAMHYRPGQPNPALCSGRLSQQYQGISDAIGRGAATEAISCETGQKPSDRADMVVRVFHMKLEEYLTDIKEGRFYGPIRAGIPSGHDTINRLILEELSYDRNKLLADSIRYSNALNSEQQEIYKNVIHRISKGDSFWYFISGHGGTGKMFLWNAILATLRMEYVLLRHVHEQSQDWTIKVRVTRISTHLDPHNPSKIMRLSFVLLDEER
ncbi:hypothetical protein U9M48_026238 [Paspalum notatum var. saurae]|uniref:ATP-dependent DNA helicase n=1 Tax=Paspalum notatum var. saurae TaxID=547442 RepID=A0AAQ3WYT3_PASNO